LRGSNLGLARVAIHRHEVAREAGEGVVLELTLGLRAKSDHFAGVGKMVSIVLAEVATGGFCPIDRLLKAAP
jgi:hypothetical protein